MEQIKQPEINWIFFTPMIDVGFWTTLSKRKLEEWKLDVSEKPIIGKYKINYSADKKSYLTLDIYSFDVDDQVNQSGPVEVQVKSTLFNVNTPEEFSNMSYKDHQQLLFSQLIYNMENYIAKKSEILNIINFKLITYANLKKYEFQYKLLQPIFKIRQVLFDKIVTIQEEFKENDQILSFEAVLKQYFAAGKVEAFFGFKYDPQSKKFSPIKVIEYLQLLQDSKNSDYIYLGMIDPYNIPNNTNGILNNLIALIIKYYELLKITEKKTLAKVKLIDLKDFLVYGLNKPYELKKTQILTMNLENSHIQYLDDKKTVFDFIGDKLDENIKSLNLKSFMDEKSIAQDAIDLNIKLMKWRVLPELNLDKIKETKCLLFGAGTLGCQLARCLIGWGIQNITFIDNGKVSYSNTVRQSLYEFEDALNGGKSKAICAADKLKKIFPGINSVGYDLQIPMPGHYVTHKEQEEKTFQAVDILEQLVQSHDAIFLMTDTREARWLPTVLANKFNKICYTIGLGFDSFVIVRHGMSSKVFDPKVNGDRLSCYFCNDIATPVNSIKDRTLDQQCTVTRPGLSFISTAYATELLMAQLHHPLGVACPASEDEKQLQENDFGIIPQHIRGTISGFDVEIYYGKAFEQCIACSNYVLDEYEKNRNDFLIKVINDSTYLHKVTKIEETLKKFQDTDCCIEIN